jgi:hypothetical protein
MLPSHAMLHRQVLMGAIMVGTMLLKYGSTWFKRREATPEGHRDEPRFDFGH